MTIRNIADVVIVTIIIIIIIIILLYLLSFSEAKTYFSQVLCNVIAILFSLSIIY